MRDATTTSASAFALDPEVDALCDEEVARPLVREVLIMTSDRWSMLVIEALSTGPVRFTHLMAKVPGISHRMLTQTLRKLERDGLVSRTSYPESPPRVEYALTALGTSFTKPLQAVITWTLDNRGEIEDSRRRFDR